jgi:hypothetical protein
MVVGSAGTNQARSGSRTADRDIEEELLEHSPAGHVRRPRVDYESWRRGGQAAAMVAPRCRLGM